MRILAAVTAADRRADEDRRARVARLAAAEAAAATARRPCAPVLLAPTASDYILYRQRCGSTSPSGQPFARIRIAPERIAEYVRRCNARVTKDYSAPPAYHIAAVLEREAPAAMRESAVARFRRVHVRAVTQINVAWPR